MIRHPLVALALTTLMASFASAAPWPERKSCPPSTYAAVNYRVPSVFRVQAHRQRPGPYLLAPDYHPCLPVQNEPIVFPCPSVRPSARPYPGLPHTTD